MNIEVIKIKKVLPSGNVEAEIKFSDPEEDILLSNPILKVVKGPSKAKIYTSNPKDKEADIMLPIGQQLIMLQCDPEPKDKEIVARLRGHNTIVRVKISDVEQLGTRHKDNIAGSLR